MHSTISMSTASKVSTHKRSQYQNNTFAIHHSDLEKDGGMGREAAAGGHRAATETAFIAKPLAKRTARRILNRFVQIRAATITRGTGCVSTRGSWATVGACHSVAQEAGAELQLWVMRTG